MKESNVTKKPLKLMAFGFIWDNLIDALSVKDRRSF